jgi:hypothetical protein
VGTGIATDPGSIVDPVVAPASKNTRLGIGR